MNTKSIAFLTIVEDDVHGTGQSFVSMQWTQMLSQRRKYAMNLPSKLKVDSGQQRKGGMNFFIKNEKTK